MIRRRDGPLPGRLLAVTGERGRGTSLALQDSRRGPPSGRRPSREGLGGEALAAVIHGERAIEMRMHLDAQAGIAAAARPGLKLEDAAVELHGVIVLDGALVLEGADAVEVSLGRGRPPGRLRVRRGLREAGIVAWEKSVEDALGLREGTRLGEPELDDEAILQGAKEPLDPSLRLRGVRADPADTELLEGAPNLGGLRPALELFSHGERGAGIAVKDPVAVGVGDTGASIAAEQLAEEQEVPVRIFLQPEDAAEDSTGGVINGGVEHQPRPTCFEPGVMAAVHLDKEPGLGHAFTAAAMAGWAAGARAADPGRAEEPLHCPTRDPQAFALSEQLGEVVVVHVRIGGAGQGEDPGPNLLGEAPGRGPAAVPMGERREAPLAHAGEKSAEVSQ